MAATLTRDAIVEVAVRLADADGIGAVSMRKVADELGAAPMSLYTHVADKDDLLAGAVDRVVAQVDLPTHTDDWRAAATMLARSLRDVLATHPWVCDLWGRAWPGPARTQLMEEVLGTFRRGGFSRRMAHHGLHLLDLFVVGAVDQDANLDMGDDPEVAIATFLAQAPVSTHPYTHEHVAHHADPENGEDDFGFLLDLLLDGLAAHHPG